MKKKILVSIFAVAAVTLLVFSLSGAWFTDQVILPGNTVSTSNFSIAAGLESAPITVTGLEPGGPWVNAGYIRVLNDGNYNAKWRMGLGNVADTSNMKGKIEVRCIMNPDDAHRGSYGPANQQLFDVWIYSIESWNDIAVCNDAVWPFTPGADAWYLLQVKLDASADNTMMNSTYSADIYFGATQYINPGW